MFLVDRVILVVGILLLIGIVSSKFSVRLGLPVLVLFLGVGMLAGEDGLGRIDFDNHVLAHALGTIALAVILFDGGLQTKRRALEHAWKPSVLLATVGVFVTAAITGLASWYLLDVPILTGLLLGSIVASTDAAAVFAVLRSQGLRLRERVAATLEVESGSNDPMAIFLTIALVEIVTGQSALGVDVVWLFLQQMGIGTVAGLAIGWVAVVGINRMNLATAGLYPVLTSAFALLAFGTAAVLGGSGFLAIYLAGIVIGNSRIVFQRGTFLFLDGLAWIGQISMFVLLGLLSTPSDVLDVAQPGLLVAAALTFVARPLAVVPLLLPFGFSMRETLLIAWVGLKGAVPIILAMYPLLFGVAEGPLLFNVVFFVVLVSATLQGWTLPLLARRLGLQEPGRPEPPATLEITSLRDVSADIVEYVVAHDSQAAGRPVRDLGLPEDAVFAMISRGAELIPPRGSSVVASGDHVFVVLRPEARAAVDEVFGREGGTRARPGAQETAPPPRS